MNELVYACIDGRWKRARLTDERAETTEGQLVVVVDGEDCARGPATVDAVMVAEEDEYRAASEAGFVVHC